MTRSLEGKKSSPFQKLKSEGDFIDGFEMTVPTDMSGRQLQRLLKESGLDASVPSARHKPGCFWIQIASGKQDIQSVMPCLKIAADKLEGHRPRDQVAEVHEVITKVDVTRDLCGSLFAKNDWKSKH